MTFGEDGLPYGGPAATVTDRYVMGEESDRFLFVLDLKFLCHGLLGKFSREDGSPDKLAVRWCIWSAWSCSGTKLRHDVKYVGLRNRQPNGELSSCVIDEGADGSLELKLGKWGAMTSDGSLVAPVSGSLM